jgi:tetratricopeptide (TPR) repeat protein
MTPKATFNKVWQSSARYKTVRMRGQFSISSARSPNSAARLEQAEAFFQQSLTIRREIQDRRGEGAALTALGQVARRRGQLEQAEAFFQQALIILREVQNRQGEGTTLAYLADIARDRGDFEQAERYYQQALAIARQTEDVFSERNILSALENLARLRGQSSKKRWSFTREEAEQAIQDAAFLAEKLGIPADHPGIPALQEQLRQMLAGDEQAGEAGEGAPPNE